MNFVKGLNLIGSNVWAFLTFIVGVILVCKNIAVGHEIVMAAFALLRGGISTGKNSSTGESADA
jgi:hypothetical protein